MFLKETILLRNQKVGYKKITFVGNALYFLTTLLILCILSLPDLSLADCISKVCLTNTSTEKLKKIN